MDELSAQGRCVHCIGLRFIDLNSAEMLAAVCALHVVASKTGIDDWGLDDMCVLCGHRGDPKQEHQSDCEKRNDVLSAHGIFLRRWY